MDDLEPVARKACLRRDLEFVGRVGEGSFKQTFQVVDPKKNPVALKVYKSSHSVERPQREISAMSRCRHVGIARLFSFDKFAHKGEEFLVITEEYLSGGTLTDRGQISGSQGLRIGKALIQAVSHIAELNLVHRDIKPDNIMFRSDDETPVITDFGVVRDLNESSITPSWAPRGPGTPYFSAPEQLRNEKNLIDWRADQFALGVSLACAIFKEHPYSLPGLSAHEVVNRVHSRKSPAAWFVKNAREAGIGSLVSMISPWPVGRYRKPAILQNAWEKQKG